MWNQCNLNVHSTCILNPFRIRKGIVIRIYQMTHSVFCKDGMLIFQGFTEIYVI